jgi:hypothetical protein
VLVTDSEFLPPVGDLDQLAEELARFRLLHQLEGDQAAPLRVGEGAEEGLTCR